MKTFFRFPVAVLLLGTMILPACGGHSPLSPNTANPVEVELPGADFELLAFDHERGWSRDSHYVFEGVWRDGHFRFGREQLDTMQLNITPDNGIILRVRSDESGFRGVNAASSARCINIVPDKADRTVYHLEWVDEGHSTITLWCGEGPSRHEIRFLATSRKDIPLEGIKVRIDGEERLMLVAREGEEPAVNFPYVQGGIVPSIGLIGASRFQQYYREFPKGYDRGDVTRHVVLEIAGPVPLNATPTTRLYTGFDAVGLIDEGFLYSGDCWLESYRLYEENLTHNPDFRWFQPFRLPTHASFSYINAGDILQDYRQSESYSLYPADLRERQAWVWPQPYTDRYNLCFYEGDIIPDGNNTPRLTKSYNTTLGFTNLPDWFWYK